LITAVEDSGRQAKTAEWVEVGGERTMRLQSKIRKRSGAYVIECAFVFPITFFLLLMIVIGSMAIFRYQECAYLARMGTRYGSVHGDGYWTDLRKLRPPNVTPGTAASPASYTDSITGIPTSYLSYTPTSSNTGPGAYTTWCDQIYGNRIYPNLMLLDPNYVSCRMDWPTVALNPTVPDDFPGSEIRVTVTYHWIPEVQFWLPGIGSVKYGPYDLTSMSSMPITY
jgi:hypothetical protein